MNKEIDEKIQKIDNESGSVIVSENVIATVVKNAALEIDGVVAVGNDRSIPGNMFDVIAGKAKINDKGIKVNIKSKNELIIEVKVIIKYGMDVVSVAKSVQEKVKDAVESLIGMHVKDVDVCVDEISMEKFTEEI